MRGPFRGVGLLCSLLGGVVSVAPAAAGQRRACLTWQPKPYAPRLYDGQFAFVYDAVREALLLLEDGNTWEWNSARWFLRDTNGSAALSDGLMVFDDRRGVAVLLRTNEDQTETWEWDGSAWTLRTTEGPPLSGGAVAYDDSRAVTFLFGGSRFDPVDSQRYLDIWGWDGTTWTQWCPSPDCPPESSPPRPRTGHSAAYDSERRVMVMYGGQVEDGSLAGDTWEWDGNAWHLRATDGPLGRHRCAMAYDEARGVTVLYGGSGPDIWNWNDETWEWDGMSWSLRAEDRCGRPIAGASGNMAYDRAHGMTVFVGQPRTIATYYSMALIWGWDGGAWRVLGDTGPAPRSATAMAYDGARRQTVMFGGVRDRCGDLADTWVLDESGWVLRSVSGPSRRMFHAIAYDSAREVVVLFGGLGEASVAALKCGPRDDTWEWTGTEWVDRTGPGPSARLGHAMAYDEHRKVTVLYGGTGSWGEAEYLDDTWERDGDKWALAASWGAGPRGHHGMAFDAGRGVTVLFGGVTRQWGADYAVTGDTWEWDGQSWNWKSADGPAPREGHMMTYDVSRGSVILYGGADPFGDLVFQDIWEWNGVRWRRLPSVGQAWFGWRHGAMAYDAARNAVVVFGGFPESATWELAPDHRGRCEPRN